MKTLTRAGHVRTYWTDAGKRTEEGYRIFTEDELKLNSGGGTYSMLTRDAALPIRLRLLYGHC